MKKRLFYTFGLIVFVMVAFVTNLAQAKDPYYHVPSWDQKLGCTPGKCPRFLVLTDWGSSEAVLDKETGLVWERAPEADGLADWYQAHGHCNQLKTGDRFGWRLPTVQELASLFDPTGTVSQALPPGHPFTLAQGTNDYWSATSSNVNPTQAWTVYFSTGGGPRAILDKTEFGEIFTWCVRGGQGVDPQ